MEYVMTKHQRVHKIKDGKLCCKKTPNKGEIIQLENIDSISKWDLCRLCFSKQERNDHPTE